MLNRGFSEVLVVREGTMFSRSSSTKATGTVRPKRTSPMVWPRAREDIKTSPSARWLRVCSKQVSKFVLDDFNRFENLVFVAGAGDDHLSGTEDETDNLGVVKSVDKTGELLGSYSTLSKGKWKVRWLRLSLRGTPACGSPVNLSTPS